MTAAAARPVAVRDWNPALYTRFEAERTRPAADLLARVPFAAQELRDAVDLGCGPGNSTALIAARFPAAALTGIDRSAAMLAAARQRLPALRFEQADIADWVPAAPPQLIFANASLHWLPDQAAQLQRLFGLLRPGGVLAVQVPDNLDEPSHRLMRATAAAGPWAAALRDTDACRSLPLAAAQVYDLLAPAAASVEVWRTVYQHPLASVRAIVDWLRASGLRPFLEPLDAAAQAAFLAAYEARLDAAYAPRADGQRLLAFPRLFHVSRRR